MLHTIDHTHSSPSQSDRLARAFLKILADDARAEHETQLTSLDDDQEEGGDDTDSLFGVEAKTLPVQRSGPRADMCAVAVNRYDEVVRARSLALLEWHHREPDWWRFWLRDRRNMVGRSNK